MTLWRIIATRSALISALCLVNNSIWLVPLWVILAVATAILEHSLRSHRR